MAHPEYTTIRVRSTSLRMLRAGQGAPLLLLRGDDASDGWRDYMDRLSQSFDVIAPEHPGFGGAQMPDWLNGVPDMANFYLDLIDALDLDNVSLMGLGLGGWIAAEMALRVRGRLASLTLVNAAGLKLPGVGGVDLFLADEEQGIRAKFVDAAKAEAEIAYKLTPESEDARIANQMVIAQLAWSPRWHDPALARWLHRAALPALVVWGEQDRLFPLAYAHEWVRLLPDAALSVIAGCGHTPQIERPEEFIGATVPFLLSKMTSKRTAA